MGYQVGLNCYATLQQAEDAYYSQVIPVIDSSGSLKQLYRSNNGSWQIDGLTLSAPLPECSISANFIDGSQIGWLIFVILAITWGFKRLTYLLR